MVRAVVTLLVLAAGCSSRMLLPADGGPDASGDLALACAGACPSSLPCCGGRCVNLANDPFNCGKCGVVCSGAQPVCAEGTCFAGMCYEPDGGAGCAPSELCCQTGTRPGFNESRNPALTCVNAEVNHGTCPVECPGCFP